jgi:hypothetical protein
VNRPRVAGRISTSRTAPGGKRTTQELLTLYVLERWLARLAVSRHARAFVLKGGLLLSVFDARRPTADADLLARNLANDQEAAIGRVREITEVILDEDDGLTYLPDTIALGEANTRVRDYADMYILTGKHPVSHDTMRVALNATMTHRGVPASPLSQVLGDFVTIRQSAYSAFRARLGSDGLELPPTLTDTVSAVCAFIDPLVDGTPSHSTWQPDSRRWQ